jgi:hypothetical protein
MFVYNYIRVFENSRVLLFGACVGLGLDRLSFGVVMSTIVPPLLPLPFTAFLRLTFRRSCAC